MSTATIFPIELIAQMKYVLDACIGIKWVLPEDDSALAIALGLQFKQRIYEWSAAPRG